MRALAAAPRLAVENAERFSFLGAISGQSGEGNGVLRGQSGILSRKNVTVVVFCAELMNCGGIGLFYGMTSY